MDIGPLGGVFLILWAIICLWYCWLVVRDLRRRRK